MSPNHGEAFCLMTYQCQKCGNREIIWNSRDGVTPFITTCYIEGCGGESQHVNWGSDVCKPDTLPMPGQRFWRDGTDEEAREIIGRRVRSAPQYIPENVTAEQFIDEISKDVGGSEGEFQRGWPHLETVPPPIKELITSGPKTSVR